MIQELREEKEGVDRGFYKEERKPEKQTKRSVRKKSFKKIYVRRWSRIYYYKS